MTNQDSNLLFASTTFSVNHILEQAGNQFDDIDG